MSERGKGGGEAELLFSKHLAFEGWTYHRARPTYAFFPSEVKHGSPLERGIAKLKEQILRAGDGPEGYELRALLGAAQRATRDVRSVSHDLFQVFDFLAIRNGQTWAVQVTTQAGRSERRRKIEEEAEWPREWRITIASHETTPDPAHRARKKHFWRLEDYVLVRREGGSQFSREWDTPLAVPFDPAAVEADAKRRRVLGKGFVPAETESAGTLFG